MATRTQLLVYRRDLADLRSARKILTANRLDVDEVDREVRRLAGWTVPVEAPCVLCGAVEQVPTRVDDPSGAIPAKCICESCDARTSVAAI